MHGAIQGIRKREGGREGRSDWLLRNAMNVFLRFLLFSDKEEREREMGVEIGRAHV